MKSRALRLTLLTLSVGLFAGAAYIIWKAEGESRAASAAARGAADRMAGTTRTLLEMKATQPGYVGAGQGDEFWVGRMDALIAAARDGIARLRPQAQSPRARTEVDAAAAALDDFQQMDKRARDYARQGQRLLASDLVFSDGIDKIDTAVAALDHAREADTALAEHAVAEQRRTQLLAAAGSAAGAILVLLALVPLPAPPAAQPIPAAAVPVERDLPIRVAPAPASAPPPRAIAPPLAAQPPPATAAAAAPASPTVDLAAVAALCTDLSRVVDTRALPAALERAAALLDASGIVLWIADPDGRELAPILAHGYPPNLVLRFGTIPRDAENVTADAFRTGLVQTVAADTVSPGAIAAPLLTPAGTVGVIAAEVRHDAQRSEATRAVAAIVAAQLAALVGPPLPRTSSNAEAAEA